MIIAAVEGVSFSGKTSLCELAKERGLAVVAEPAVYADGRFRRAATFQDARYNALLTLEIERERKRDTDKIIGQAEEKAILCDRSVFSLLALSKAYQQAAGFDFFEEIKEEVVKGLESGEFILPNFFLFFDVNIQTLQERSVLRKTNFPDFWLSKEFITAQQNYYKKIGNFYAKKNALLIVKDYNEVLDKLLLGPPAKISVQNLVKKL